ncbi:MAG: hypothetical protein AAGH68_08770 [Pseudomonadota bacterium]
MVRKPETLSDSDLEETQGGGLLDSEAGTFGFEPITLERGVRRPATAPEWTNPNDGDPGYIGETEKNVWKTPAGIGARKR